MLEALPLTSSSSEVCASVVSSSGIGLSLTFRLPGGRPLLFGVAPLRAAVPRRCVAPLFCEGVVRCERLPALEVAAPVLLAVDGCG